MQFRNILFVAVAALAIQSAAAGGAKADSKSSKGGDSYGAKAADSYGSKGDSGYGSSADSYGSAAPTVVAVPGSPVAVSKTSSCKPATVAVTAAPVFVCPRGYNSTTTGGKMTCTRTACKSSDPVAVTVTLPVDPVVYAPKPAPVVYADAPVASGYAAQAASSGYGKADSKMAAKYGHGEAKASKADAYGSASADSYGSASADSYGSSAPSTQTVMAKVETVCAVFTAKPVATCTTGTMSGSVCIVGTKTAACPAGYTAANGVCSKTTTTMVPGAPTYVTVAAPKPAPVVYAPKPAPVVYADAPVASGYAAQAASSGYGKADSKMAAMYGHGEAKASEADAYGSDSSDSYSAGGVIPACP
jgi:hypothetical protein